MDLTLNFTGEPPLLRLTAEEHSTAAPPPLLLPPIEKNATTPLTTTLSLGSLNPLPIPMANSSPEKPNKDNNNNSKRTTDSMISESTTQSVVTQEDTQVVSAAKKIDQECTSTTTADSRRSVKLFGVSLDYDNSVNQVAAVCKTRNFLPLKKRACFRGGFAVKKRKMEGEEYLLLGQEDSNNLKKKACFRGGFAVKKRKMEGAEYLLGQEDSNYSKKYLLPFKKRAFFRGVDDDMVIKMTKVLTQSDVNSQSRFLLGNKVFMIDQILPRLNLSVETFANSDHGEKIKVYDMDMKIERTLVLKRWITNSFVINGGWRKYFVMERKLKKGDEIELSWDRFAKRLNFSVVKRAGSS